MTPSDLIDRFGERYATEKRVLATLALIAPTLNKTRLAYTSTTLDHYLTI